MFGRLVGLATTIALGANAFLLPPGIAGDGKASAALTGPGADTGFNPNHQIIALPCPECAFRTEKTSDVDSEDDDGLMWIQGGANSLLMSFIVTDDGREVQLNGAPLFPMDWIMDDSKNGGRFTTEQIPSDADTVKVTTGEVQSATLNIDAFSLHVTEGDPHTETGDAMYFVNFGILSVNGEAVDVAEVEARLLRTGDGQLFIMELVPHRDTESASSAAPFRPPFGGPEMNDVSDDMARPPPPPPSPPHGGHHHHSEGEGCSMLPGPLCRLKNIIDSKIDHAMHFSKHSNHDRPCPGRKGQGTHLPSHIKTHFDGPHWGGPHKGDHSKSHHGRPHHMRPHGGHHGHHGYHRHHLLRDFAKGVVAVLIPVMAGITVGLTVSLIGLLVGRLISLLWVSVVRGGRRGSASAAHEEPVLEVDEDKAMLAEMEAPPVYEEAPAYEDVKNENR